MLEKFLWSFLQPHFYLPLLHHTYLLMFNIYALRLSIVRNLSEISCIELDAAQNSRKAVPEHISKEQQDTTLSLTRILGDCLYIHVFLNTSINAKLKIHSKAKIISSAFLGRCSLFFWLWSITQSISTSYLNCIMCSFFQTPLYLVNILFMHCHLPVNL